MINITDEDFKVDQTKFYPIENDTLLNVPDFETIVLSYIHDHGLICDNIERFDEFINTGIPEIITNLFTINRTVKCDSGLFETIVIKATFNKVTIGYPTKNTQIIGTADKMYPQDARLNKCNYEAPIYAGLDVNLTAIPIDKTKQKEEKHFLIRPQLIGHIPIMVMSNRCHLRGLSHEAMKLLHEDPLDQGGYFIISGNEYSIKYLENVKYNYPRCHLALRPGEIGSCQLLSQTDQAFGNSSDIVIRHMTDNSIWINIRSAEMAEGTNIFPWYMIYRLFGVSNDEEMINTVLPEFENSDTFITNNINEIFEQSFDRNYGEFYESLKHVRDYEKILLAIGKYSLSFVKNKKFEDSDPEGDNYLINRLKGILDDIVFPHIGKTPEYRQHKIKFLGLCLRKLFLTELGILPENDRTSYSNKRVFGACGSLGKILKDIFNNEVIKKIRQDLNDKVKTTTWEKLNQSTIEPTVSNCLSNLKLSAGLARKISTGNSDSDSVSSGSSKKINRISSQTIKMKNNIRIIDEKREITMNNPNSSAAGTASSYSMRQVHPTHSGLVCANRTPEGKKVGTVRSIAITATATGRIDTNSLKMYILKDPEFITLDYIGENPQSVIKNNYAKIFINGAWIGCCVNSKSFCDRYRYYRRIGKIVHRFIGIYWDIINNEIHFLGDFGRLVRPALIVDNNFDEWANAIRTNAKVPEFTQSIRLTKQHISQLITGELHFDDLINQGIMEYLCAEEQENCLFAEDFGQLCHDTHNYLRQYTHCEIPIQTMGLSPLLSPYANHTQPVRVTTCSLQILQTGGWYKLNNAYRIDKDVFFQHYNEQPLISTMMNRLLPANGENLFIAYQILQGDNMEDSVIINKAAVDRGLLAGEFYRYQSYELEKNERFCTPDILKTAKIRHQHDYSKLIDGFVPLGTIVNKGDVLIGVISRINEKTSATMDYDYKDNSMVYKNSEPGTVVSVIRPNDRTEIGIIKIMYYREIVIGDKVSTRSGNKSIIAKILPQSDMPYTEDGRRPDIIMSPESIPTRMTLGQMIETSMSKVAIKKGTCYDGTAYGDIDTTEIPKIMEDNGFGRSGLEMMRNPITGNVFLSKIEMGCNGIHRLLKFVKDDMYAVMDGQRDPLSGQPSAGKNIGGSLRLGEMEFWSLGSHGASHTISEKAFLDSDYMQIPVCNRCGSIAIYNNKKKIYKCKLCKDLADIEVLNSAQSTLVTMEYLMSAGINVRLATDTKKL